MTYENFPRLVIVVGLIALGVNACVSREERLWADYATGVKKTIERSELRGSQP